MLHLENFFEKSFALLLTTPIKKIKNKKCLTSFLKSDMILNVAANNGNTTMTTQKQFEEFYEQKNNFLKRNKKS